jgi:hypothetical protein
MAPLRMPRREMRARQLILPQVPGKPSQIYREKPGRRFLKRGLNEASSTGNMARITALVVAAAMLPLAAGFAFSPATLLRPRTSASRMGSVSASFTPLASKKMSLRSSRLATGPRMAADHGFDYDLIIVGCGVGGHGAALHARAQVSAAASSTAKDTHTLMRSFSHLEYCCWMTGCIG